MKANSVTLLGATISVHFYKDSGSKYDIICAFLADEDLQPTFDYAELQALNYVIQQGYNPTVFLQHYIEKQLEGSKKLLSKYEKFFDHSPAQQTAGLQFLLDNIQGRLPSEKSAEFKLHKRALSSGKLKNVYDLLKQRDARLFRTEIWRETDKYQCEYKHFAEIWDSAGDNEEITGRQVLALLKDYTQNNNAWARLIHLHWRHHAKSVHEIYRSDKDATPTEILAKIKIVKVGNDQGTLATLIDFVNNKITQSQQVQSESKLVG